MTPKSKRSHVELKAFFSSVDRILLATTSRVALFLYGIVGAIGVAILLVGKFPELINRVQGLTLQQIGFYLFSFPFLILFSALYFRTFLRIYRRRILGDDSDDFLSVDRRAATRRNKEVVTAEQILTQIKHAGGRSETFNYEKIREIVEQTVHRKEKDPPVGVTTFTTYFAEIVETLEAKANAADEKASILLNKGTSYTQWGITFFILSIIAWQVLAWIHTFQTQFVYGIASCSFLFAFIEFLSAWFLRQYRHFVDTSTYLLRVKAILDRYFLTYLAAKEQSKADGSIDTKAFTALNALLKEPIRWPETELFDKANTSFARDAAESLTSLAHELRGKKA